MTVIRNRFEFYSYIWDTWKSSKNKNILIIRPLLNISKKDLMYVSKNTFGSFVNDPSNYNKKFLRIHVRKIINDLFKYKIGSVIEIKFIKT